MIGDPLAPQRHRWSYLEDVKFKHEWRRWFLMLVLACGAAIGVLHIATTPAGTQGPTWEQYERQRP